MIYLILRIPLILARAVLWSVRDLRGYYRQARELEKMLKGR